jgi:hypothetical protein
MKGLKVSGNRNVSRGFRSRDLKGGETPSLLKQ